MALHHDIIRHASSSQSHVIVAAVLFSFIVWVTLRGHLARYLNDLGIGNKAAGQQAAGQAIGGIAGGGIGAVQSILPTLPNLAPGGLIPN